MSTLLIYLKIILGLIEKYKQNTMQFLISYVNFKFQY